MEDGAQHVGRTATLGAKEVEQRNGVTMEEVLAWCTKEEDATKEKDGRESPQRWSSGILEAMGMAGSIRRRRR